MSFERPIAFDSTYNSIRWACRVDTTDTVICEVDTDPAFSNPIASSPVVAAAASDYVVRGEVTGLQADTLYYHRFRVNGSVVTYETEPKGTGTDPAYLKTAPLPGARPAEIKIAFGSCSRDPATSNTLNWESIDAKAPDLFIHLGDRFYIENFEAPPTSQSVYFDAYKALHRNDGVTYTHYTRYISLRRASKFTWDDHDVYPDWHVDYAGGDQLRTWAFNAWDIYTPHAPLENSPALFRTERWGPIEFFFLDLRYKNQLWSTHERWPFDGADNHVVETTSTKSQIVLKDAGLGHVLDKTANYYRGWYVQLSAANLARTVVRPPRSDMWARVESSAQTASDEVTLTLNTDLDDSFDPTVHQYLYMEKASILDGDFAGDGVLQTGNQWDWLVNSLRASTALVKIIVSSLPMNETQTEDDNWRKFSAKTSEIRTLFKQVKDVKNVFVLSGDSHRHQMDDGANGEWPEFSSSPLSHTGSIGAPSFWSHGQAVRPSTNPDGSSNGFCLLTITPTELTAEYFWSNNGTPISLDGVADPLSFTLAEVLDAYTIVYNGNFEVRGRVGEAISETPAVSGGTPTAWTVVGGSLPAGLTLDYDTGVISGTPTAAVQRQTVSILAQGIEGETYTAVEFIIEAAASSSTPAGTLEGIRYLLDLLMRKVGLYAQKNDFETIQRRRKTQVEELRGQVETLEKGADQLEKSAEDIEQRISALGG